MTSRELYRLNIPEDAIEDSHNERQRQVDSAGTVSAGEPWVKAVSQNPAGTMISGQFRGRYAEKMAKEVEELFSSGDIEEVPFYGGTAASYQDGYYTLDDLPQIGPLSRDETRVQLFRGRATKVGSMKTHFRAMETSPVTIENPQGSDNDALVGIPDSAIKRFWYNRNTGEKSIVAPAFVTSFSTAYGDVAQFDTLLAPYDNPTMLYEVDYEEEGKTDAKIWDTRGFSSKLNGNNVLQWQKVFASDHEFSGDVVFDNGIYRYYFDESAGTVDVETWSSGSWSDVTPTNPGNWEVNDVDIYNVTPVGVRAQIQFHDTSAGASPEYYSYNFVHRRGVELILMFDPPSQTSVSTPDLDDWFSGVTSDSANDADPHKTLVRREEVRK